MIPQVKKFLVGTLLVLAFTTTLACGTDSVGTTQTQIPNFTEEEVISIVKGWEGLNYRRQGFTRCLLDDPESFNSSTEAKDYKSEITISYKPSGKWLLISDSSWTTVFTERFGGKEAGYSYPSDILCTYLVDDVTGEVSASAS